MKITILRLVLVLFAFGCSKASTTARPQFALTRGDFSLPVEITTNKDEGTVDYFVHIRLSNVKETELCKFSQKHPNGFIDIVAGTNVVMTVQVPAAGLNPPVGLTVSSDVFDNVNAIAYHLRELSK